MTKGEALQLRGKIIAQKREAIQIMGNIQLLRRQYSRDDTGIHTTLQDAVDHQADAVSALDQSLQILEGII
jgi:hypothetical protein